MEGDKFSWFEDNYRLEKRPRYSQSSYPDEQMPSTSTASSSSYNQPSTSSASHRRTQSQRILIEQSDERLLRWQERQISKCIRDNLANGVVEWYMRFTTGEELAHLTATRDNNDHVREAYLASYHAERVHQNLENSAIMRAIGQFGLQKHSCHQLFDENRSETMSTSSSSISLSSPPDSPSTRDDWYHYDGINTLKPEKSPNNEPNKIERTDNLPTNQNNDAIVQGTEPLADKSNEKELNALQSFDSGDPTADEHFNFLEAAVSAAIQEKGLMSYPMQKSPNR